MLAIHDLCGKIISVKWSPHDDSTLIAMEKNFPKIQVINYKTGKQKILEMDTVSTAMCWHPRMPNHVIFGGIKGMLSLCNVHD